MFHSSSLTTLRNLNQTTCFTVAVSLHLEESLINSNYMFHSSNSSTLRRITAKTKPHVYSSSSNTFRRITAKTQTTRYTVPASLRLEESLLKPNYMFHSSSFITLRRGVVRWYLEESLLKPNFMFDSSSFITLRRGVVGWCDSAG